VVTPAVAPLLLSVSAGDEYETSGAARGERPMKIIHASLEALLTEVKQRNVGAVRVGAVMENDAVGNGIPRCTSWIVVSAPVGWDQWIEWRHCVGRDGTDSLDEADDIPPAVLGVINERLSAVWTRVVGAGLEVRDGVIANETEAMDGDLG
jgi:hypothetical protein